MDENGRVQTKEYPGFWFTPFKILPLEAGRKKLEALNELRVDYRSALNDFQDSWKVKAATILHE